MDHTSLGRFERQGQHVGFQYRNGAVGLGAKYNVMEPRIDLHAFRCDAINGC